METLIEITRCVAAIAVLLLVLTLFVFLVTCVIKPMLEDFLEKKPSSDKREDLLRLVNEHDNKLYHHEHNINELEQEINRIKIFVKMQPAQHEKGE